MLTCLADIVVKAFQSGGKWWTNIAAIPRATHSWNLSFMSTVMGGGLWTPVPPARLSNGQLASPMRLMAHRPHLDPFISCFQNDISLATEDQQAWHEQRSSVSQPQTNTREGEHAKVMAGWDRQGHHGSSFDPHRDTEVYWSGSSGRWDIYGRFWRQPVYRGAWQGPIVFQEPQGRPHCTNVD